MSEERKLQLADIDSVDSEQLVGGLIRWSRVWLLSRVTGGPILAGSTHYALGTFAATAAGTAAAASRCPEPIGELTC